MPYNMDMNDEKKPKIKRALPEGWTKAVITNCTESRSKAGNLMFIVELTFKDHLNYSEDVYLVGEPKKRWALKSLLAACGVDAAQDGNYSWDIPDIMDKEINVLVENEDNTWINRNGDEVTTKQNRFSDFQPIAWDE